MDGRALLEESGCGRRKLSFLSLKGLAASWTEAMVFEFPEGFFHFLIPSLDTVSPGTIISVFWCWPRLRP